MMNICGRGVFAVLIMCFAMIQGKIVSNVSELQEYEFILAQQMKFYT